MMKGENVYYYSIDTFKFICAIVVVVVHVTSRLESYDIASWNNYYFYRYILDIGTPFFLIASGFVLQKKYLEKGSNYFLDYSYKIFKYYIIFSVFYMVTRMFFEVLDAAIVNNSIKSAIANELSNWTSINILNGSIGSFQLYFLVMLIYSARTIYLLKKIKLSASAIFLIATFFYLLENAEIFAVLNFLNIKIFHLVYFL